MTVLHPGRNSFTEMVWQFTVYRLVYLEEETLTSMEIHIQYNYSWRICAFLVLSLANTPEQLTMPFHF